MSNVDEANATPDGDSAPMECDQEGNEDLNVEGEGEGATGLSSLRLEKKGSCSFVNPPMEATICNATVCDHL